MKTNILFGLLTCVMTFSQNVVAAESEAEARAAATADRATELGLAADARALDGVTCMGGTLAQGKNGNPNVYKPSWVFGTMRKEFGTITAGKRGRTYLDKGSSTSWVSEVSFVNGVQHLMAAWYVVQERADGTMCISGMLH